MEEDGQIARVFLNVILISRNDFQDEGFWYKPRQSHTVSPLFSVLPILRYDSEFQNEQNLINGKTNRKFN